MNTTTNEIVDDIPKGVLVLALLVNGLEGIIFFVCGIICLLNAEGLWLGVTAGILMIVYGALSIYYAIGPNRKKIAEMSVVSTVANMKPSELFEEDDEK